MIRRTVFEYVVFKKGGFAVEGVPIRFTGDELYRCDVSEPVKEDVIHLWWRKLGDDAVKSLVRDCITFSLVSSHMDCICIFREDR